MRTYRRRGVSSIIAAVFILATLLTFIVALSLIMQRLSRMESRILQANQEMLAKAGQRLRFDAIVITGQELQITVTNTGTQPILLIYYIIINASVKLTGKISPPAYVEPSSKTTISITLPQPLSPASTYRITLVSKLGSSFHATYPLPKTSTAALPGIQATLANTYLARVSGSGTVTWAGTAKIPAPNVRAGNVTEYEVLNGVLAGSSPPNYLNYSDNRNITVVSKVGIILKSRSVVVYSDYSTDPFTSGQLKDYYNTGTWDWDQVNQYVYQSSTSITLTASGEIIATFTKSVPQTGRLYLLQEVNTTSSNGYLDLIALSSASGYFYTLSLYYSTKVGTALYMDSEIWKYNGSWHNLTDYSTLTARFRTNRWYWELGYIDFSTGTLNLTIYSYTTAGLVKEDSAEGVDTAFLNPDIVGIGSFGTTGTYDDFVATVNAIPLYVNVTNVPAGYTVDLYDASGNLIASATAGSNGVATLKVIPHPIVRDGNITIYTSSGSKYATAVFPIVVAGDVYSVNYVVTLKDTSVANLTGVLKLLSIGVGVRAQSNLSTTSITVYAYNWLLGGFDEVASSIGGIDKNVTGLTTQLINQTNDTVVLKIVASDSSPFNLSVDVLNAFPEVLVISESPILIVGEGGTNYIDIYRISSTAPGNVAFTYWETIDAHTLFNGSADLAYDNYVTYSLILINASGVYNVSLVNASKWNLITASLKATGPGVRAEVVANSTSNKSLLVVMPGEGNDTIYVYNLTRGAIRLRSLGALGLKVSSAYTASAYYGETFYTILENSTSYKAVLIEYNPFTDTIFIPPYNTTNFMPGLSLVGLTYGGGYLWLMLEGGSLYQVDPSTAAVTHLSIYGLPPPLGYGDRLEYYDDALILARSTGTAELWVIPQP